MASSPSFKINPMYTFSSLRIVILFFLAIGLLQGCKPGSDNKGSGPKPDATPEWLVMLNDAYAQSAKTQKPILAYFTASDTCSVCKEMEANSLASPMFSEWAEKNVILFKVDLAKSSAMIKGDQEQNTAMAQALKISTYPTFWILRITHETENGRFKVKPVGYTGYQPTTEKLLGALQNFVHMPSNLNE